MRRTILLLLTLALVCVGCGKPKSIDGETAYVRNPDCGFYTPVLVVLRAEEAAYTLNEPLLVRNNLLHLRVDLGAFSSAGGGADGDVPQAALMSFAALLNTLREHSVNAVVRFAYDAFEGNKDCEPTLDVMRGHIAQMGAVLAGYTDVLTAVEAGMIGPWGEMHSSKLANDKGVNAVMAAWLSALPAPVPVLVRRPTFIALYLGIAVYDLKYFTALPGTDAYRLGVFNDGYLGSETDLGTYVDREGEIGFLSRQAAHLPFGGEVTVPNSPFNAIEYAATEMFSTHTSYLNELWNDQVIASWKESPYTQAAGPDKDYHGLSAYVYIRDHLGYRFTLEEVIYPDRVKGNMKVKLRIKSDGFGNLNKSKTAELVFAGENGTFAVPVGLDATAWKTGATYKETVKVDTASVPGGHYTLYLRLRDPNEVRYAVALMNGSFDENTLGNKLGEIRVNN